MLQSISPSSVALLDSSAAPHHTSASQPHQRSSWADERRMQRARQPMGDASSRAGLVGAAEAWALWLSAQWRPASHKAGRLQLRCEARMCMIRMCLDLDSTLWSQYTP